MDPFEKLLMAVIAVLCASLLSLVSLGWYAAVRSKGMEFGGKDYLVSRIVECEHQISLLRERIERLEESK